MPGENCSILNCPVSRRYKDVSIFKIPSATNDSKAKWRKELINVITKDRVIDEALRKQIASNNLHICEKHFSEDQLWVYGNKKQMKDDVIPSLNLPIKSIVSPPVPPRPLTVFPLIEDRSYIFFIDLKWGSYIRGDLVIEGVLYYNNEKFR